MPKTTCKSCGSPYQWTWEEAFEKFGFSDGDGQVETQTVAFVLECAGYNVQSHPWGLHNTVITSIKRRGRELVPESAKVGYDDPRGYLPKGIIALLDKELAADAEMVS